MIRMSNLHEGRNKNTCCNRRTDYAGNVRRHGVKELRNGTELGCRAKPCNLEETDSSAIFLLILAPICVLYARTICVVCVLYSTTAREIGRKIVINE